MASKNVVDCAKKVSLAELAKRVPPNQSLQFAHFNSKCEEYQARVNKLPSELPAIDWEFYMMNIKPEMKKWVKEFQQKYKNLSDSFDARASRDYSKCYFELEEASAVMQCDIENFRAESDERIKKLQAEYESIKSLKPYEDMTWEEYCEMMPDKKMYMHEGHPSYWPHKPEEQALGRPEGHDHDHDHDRDASHAKSPKDGKTPKGGSGEGKNDGGSAAPVAAASRDGAGGDKDAKKEANNDGKPTKSAMKSPSTSTFGKKVKFATTKLPQKPKIAEKVKATARRAYFEASNDATLPDAISSDIVDGIAKKSDDSFDSILKKSTISDSQGKKPDFPNVTIEEQIKDALFPTEFKSIMKARHGAVAQK